MLRRAAYTRWSQSLAILGATLLLGAEHAAAAPRITAVMNAAPPHAQVGAKLLFAAEGLVPPVRVFFSDGTNPTVEASGVQYDSARGFLFAQVPAGSQTGYMKIKANGVDSPLHYFRVDAGVYNPGSATVQGNVAGPGGAVTGAMLALLRPSGCDGMSFVDLTVSGAAGAYTLHGSNGEAFVFAFPPAASGLAATVAPATLGPAPVIVPIQLSAGTTVNGRVVKASSPGTGVANARVEFEGDGYETRLTDANGYFSAVLAPGGVDMATFPSPVDALARDQQHVGIVATTPQLLPNTALGSGVRIHGIARRAADGLPMPGVRLSARSQNSCCEDRDKTASLGDGSYVLVVPANDTYQLNASLEDDAAFADVYVSDVAVGPGDVLRNVDIQDAGAITGTVVDAVTGNPVTDIDVQAFEIPYTGFTRASARTCGDGSFRLRVAPNATGYVAAIGFYNAGDYIPVAWHATAGQTFYSCEGTPISMPSAATVVTGVDLHIHSGSVAISGDILSQASGCSTAMGGSNWMLVDDGAAHNCGLGYTDWNAPAGTYRVAGLPGSDLVPALRVCHPGLPGGTQQCWDTMRPPSFSPLVVAPHGEATGIDFCLGDVPTRAVSGVRASKGGGVVTFTWTATDDPYQSQYRLRASSTARPSSGTGSFPNDPPFDIVWSGLTPSASVSLSDSRAFFLVTNAGSGGVEGPCGGYGH